MSEDTERPSNVVVIMSGGLDSTVAMHYSKSIGSRPVGLSFRYGQKHEYELGKARQQCYDAGIPHYQIDMTEISFIFASSALVNKDVAVPTTEEVLGDPQPASYVPNRNMIFLSLAAAFAEAHGMHAIAYGAQRHDIYGYWDTTTEFVDRLRKVFQLNRKNPMQLLTPLVDMSKAEVVALGLKLGVDFSRTWSCYNGPDVLGRACGTCPTCAERYTAFKLNGIEDPIKYAEVPNVY